jgi:hypothetical protein
LPAPSGSGSLLLGIQRRDDVEQIVPMAQGDVELVAELHLHQEGDVVDVRGPYANGRKGDRFLYLCWGRGADATMFERFARIKLKFEDVPHELLAELADRADLELVATAQATGRKGQVASGTIRPPAVTWVLGPAADA